MCTEWICESESLSPPPHRWNVTEGSCKIGGHIPGQAGCPRSQAGPSRHSSGCLKEGHSQQSQQMLPTVGEQERGARRLCRDQKVGAEDPRPQGASEGNFLLSPHSHTVCSVRETSSQSENVVQKPPMIWVIPCLEPHERASPALSVLWGCQPERRMTPTLVPQQNLGQKQCPARARLYKISGESITHRFFLCENNFSFQSLPSVHSAPPTQL